ncbi:MAG: ArsA family ATPase [Acidobacteria bacterium]|nr:ArsA family ATPase [Acidobacteriota bacterium]
MRIIFYTGKGGVGKTTIAAATGMRLAELGYKTLVMSTDSAHSLADAFDLELGSTPKEVVKNLFLEEVDVNYELKVNWGKIRRFIAEFLRHQGFEDLAAEEFAIFPGMEELFSLLKLKEYYEREEYKVGVIDCAPTGNTLQMLSLPDVIGWYMEKFFHIQRRIVKTIRPVAERIIQAPLPTDDIHYSVEELYLKIDVVSKILTDPDISSVRIVFNPEKMVIKESQRILTYLNLFHIPIDSVYANRIFPEEKSPFVEKRKRIQEEYLKLAEEAFSPLPIFYAPFYEEEIIGAKLLSKMAKEMFGDRDPAEIFSKERPVIYEKTKEGYMMSLRLPSAKKEDIEILSRGDELIIQIKNVKRNILLPRSLSGMKVGEARFEGDTLRISFLGGDENG